MKKIISLSALLYVFVQMSAQTTSTSNITGTVFDNATKESIEMASIRILNVSDSSYVTGGVTNETGKFSVSVKSGRYIAQISFLGYVNQYLNINTREKTNLGNIYLKEDGILLSEATVEAKAIEIQIKGDTVEYNADSYKVQQSAVVEDLLKRIPGAEVDAEGKITVNGKEIKKILVDGKEFFSDDPKVASKNLPAQMVDKLQVLDRKSDMAQMTGFDDGEEETVINLTIKKGMKEGLYGSATGGYGTDDRYGASAIANYMRNNSQFTLMGGSNNTNNAGFTDNAGSTFRGMRGGGMNFGGRNGISTSHSGGFNFATETTNKLKWGGNVRLGDTENDVVQSSYTQEYKSTDPKGDQYTYRNNIGNSQSMNVGADLRFEFTPDTLTRIIFSPNFRYGRNTTWQNSNSLTTYIDPNDTINWGNSQTYSRGNSRDVSGRLEVSRTIGKPGRVLSFSISGGYNDLENNGTNWSETFFKDPTVPAKLTDRITNQKNNGYNWRGYVSYVEPLGRSNFLQVNYSYRKSYSESNTDAFLNDGFGNYTEIDTTSTKKLENNFINQEIGLNFKAVRAKYNYTIGFALQPSSSESWTIQPQNTSNVSNNVLNFAPVAQFNYLWDRRHNLRINYNGRTGQPSTTQLSDVRDESDPMNIRYGNPNLKPSFTHRFSLRYQKSNPEVGSSLMGFGGFNISTNDIVDRSYSIENLPGGKEITYDNINGNWSANLRVIYNTPLRNKKFSINSMSFINYQNSNAYIDEGKNTSKTLSLAETLGLNFRSDMFDFGVRANFRFSDSRNSIKTQNNTDRTTYDYGGSGNFTLRLPYDLSIESDMTYTANSGYNEGFSQKVWLWNAGIYKQVFKNKSGTIKVNVYDILKEQTNINQSFNARQYSETITNTLGRYVMFSFSYRFQLFKGGASRTDMEGEGGGMYRGRGFGGPPGGGRGPGGPM